MCVYYCMSCIVTHVMDWENVVKSGWLVVTNQTMKHELESVCVSGNVTTHKQLNKHRPTTHIKGQKEQANPAGNSMGCVISWQMKPRLLLEAWRTNRLGTYKHCPKILCLNYSQGKQGHLFFFPPPAQTFWMILFCLLSCQIRMRELFTGQHAVLIPNGQPFMA